MTLRDRNVFVARRRARRLHCALADRAKQRDMRVRVNMRIDHRADQRAHPFAALDMGAVGAMARERLRREGAVLVGVRVAAFRPRALGVPAPVRIFLGPPAPCAAFGKIIVPCAMHPSPHFIPGCPARTAAHRLGDDARRVGGKECACLHAADYTAGRGGGDKVGADKGRC